MSTVPKPAFKIVYDGKDITQDVSRNLISLKYTDKVQGESDELNIVLEDSQDLWKNSWKPVKGSKISAWIGKGDNLLPCGTMEIDEIELEGPPDQVIIRCLAAKVTGSMRTKKTTAHENCSLKQIAEKVAGDNGLTIDGEIEDIQFTRQTQFRETDLAFLKRISQDFGYLFSVRDSKLVFTSIFKIEKGSAIRSVDRTECITYKIKDKTSMTYKGVTVAWHNPTTNKVVEQKIQVETKTNVDGISYQVISTDDVLEVRNRVETDAQADKVANAAAHSKNSLQQEGSITIPGDPLMCAGNNFDLTGFGQVSGTYHICESTHECDKSGGHLVNLEIKRVGFLAIKKHKPKTARKKRAYEVEEIE